MNPEVLQSILLTIITAATPLLIAAIGELVAERAGVLNLGVEGMMIIGASVGFAAAHSFDATPFGAAVSSWLGAFPSTWLGALAGALAGLLLSAVFALLTIGLAASQVASGLATTALGLGLSGLVGASFVGLKRETAPPLHIPYLSNLPYVGRVLFGEDLFVYLALALVIGVSLFLGRTRAGLTLRAVGDNQGSAHALGVPVRRVRLLAVLFGGACAGLAGSYLSLAYTPFWAPGMTAGRGWIALALVVFASWRPWRAVAGALLFGGASILQLQAQAWGIAIPSQFMSSIPYLATIVALVVLSIGFQRGIAAPAALGVPFVPDR